MAKFVNATCWVLLGLGLGFIQNLSAQITITKTDVTCYNCSNGTAKVKVEGGTPPYEYIWPNGARGNQVTGLAPGYYVVVVVDSNQCSGSKGFTIENYQQPPDPFTISVTASSDPNDITGPSGYGESRWVSVNDELPYRIRFENDPKFATAAANKVVVYFPFDNIADMLSFRLNSFSFRGLTFEVSDKSASYNKRLMLADSLGVNIDVTAGVDVTQKRAFWIFQAIDPKTGMPNQNPQNGFILINDSINRKGEGEVNFTLKAKTSTQTGDTLKAYADIVFDTNSSLRTNLTWNKIDAKPPVSRITKVNILNPENAEVFWTGADDTKGSGLGNFKVLISSENQPYAEAASSSDTSVIIALPAGVEYRIQIIAQDNAKNTEKLKQISDTVISLIPKVRLGKDISFCIGDSVELNAGNGFESYVWNTGSANQRIYVKSPGTYSVTAKRDTLVSSDTIVIKLNQLPVLALSGNSKAFCEGDSLSISAGNGFKSYQWNNSKTTSAIITKTPGKFKVLVTDYNNCKSSDSINVTMNAKPKLFLGNDTTINDVSKYVLVPKPNNFKTYLWNNGSVNDSLEITPDRNTPGKIKYWLKVTDNNNCQSTDTVYLTFQFANKIEFVKNKQVKIYYYPNPFGDYLNLSVDGALKNDIKVEIFDAAGTLEYSEVLRATSSKTIHTLNLSSLIQGNYILKVTFDKEEISGKVIKR